MLAPFNGLDQTESHLRGPWGPSKCTGCQSKRTCGARHGNLGSALVAAAAAIGVESNRALGGNNSCSLHCSPPLITPPARAIRHRRTVAENWAAPDQRVHDLALKLPTLIDRIAGGGRETGPPEPPARPVV